MDNTRWFEGALRPDTLMSELPLAVAELADGRLELVACRVSRIRAVAGEDGWLAVYEMDVRDPRSGSEQTITARGTLSRKRTGRRRPASALPFGVDGWTCVLPALHLHLLGVTVDAALPGLAVMTDPEQAGLLLEGALRDGGHLPEDVRLAGCVPAVVAHKLGVRATMVCRLDWAGGPPGGPPAVVVKIHADDEVRRAHEAMQALWAALAADPRVRVAAPLAYLPELGLSVQEHLSHQRTLKDLFHEAFDGGSPATWSELVDTVRATAAGLAAVHTSGCSAGEPVSWAEELATIRAKHERLTAVLPGLRERTAAALDRIEAAASRHAADPLRPAHHSFRPAQVLLLDGGGVGFIDFDKFCQAEPASDIAEFTSKLRHMALNKVSSAVPGDDRARRVAELTTAFQDEYDRHARVSPARVAVWEALELFSLVLSAAKKVNAEWIEGCCGMLEEHLDVHDL